MIDNQDDIRVDLEVERDGETFRIIALENVWTKSPSDANWHPGITYVSLSAGDDKVYCRRLDDFMRKFSLIEEADEE